MASIGCCIEFDLFCNWDTEQDPPEYRLYVKDTMVTERTYRQSGNQYLHEIIPLDLEPGEYYIHLVHLNENGKFRMRNIEATKGPIKIIDDVKFEVINAG